MKKTKQEHQKSLITRLRRVEGQIRGIQGMIEGDSDCETIAQQLAAARKALDRVFYEMVACSLEQHLDAARNVDAARAAATQMTQVLAKYG